MATTVKYVGGVHNLKVVTDGEDGPIYEDDVYNGFDHAKGKDGAFTLFAGDETEVGDRCAAALAAKYPGCFEIDGVKSEKKRSRGKTKKDDPAETLRAELQQTDREQLNEIATEVGIDSPEDVDVDELVDAIVAKKFEA